MINYDRHKYMIIKTYLKVVSRFTPLKKDYIKCIKMSYDNIR